MNSYYVGICRGLFLQSISHYIGDNNIRDYVLLGLRFTTVVSFLDEQVSISDRLCTYEPRSKWLKTTLVLQEFVVRDVNETL
jgi:hypothetical protein